MDPFITQLASLCREHVTRSKWVFVPSHAIGHTIGERIALGGTNWLNLRFVTPLDIALRMGAPFLVERGIEPSEEGLGPALMMRLLLDLPASALAGSGAAGSASALAGSGAAGPCALAGSGAASPSGGYFRPLADQPSMAQALWSTMRELRMAGIKASDFAELAAEPEERVPTFALTRFGAAGLFADSPSGRPRLRADASARQAVRGHPREVLQAVPEALPAPCVTSEGFESAAKYAELHALLASYEQFLAAGNRTDMAGVYVEAMQHQDWCPIQAEDCWTELPDVIWAPLQRRLIDAMPGERIAPKALALPGTQVPRRLAGTRVDRVDPDGTVAPMAFLPAPQELTRQVAQGPSTSSVPPGSSTSGVALAHSTQHVARDMNLFSAGGREAEIEEVFRRILAAGVPLDNVEIACASDEHVALVWEKALRHEWPVTLGPGIPAPSTRPGRALLGFCDWIETDFSAGHLRRLLQSGDMGIEEEDEGFTAGQAARTLARAEAGWGRATYELSLGLLARSYESRAGDPDLADDEREAAKAKAELTAKIADWITKLIAPVPLEAHGKVPLQGVVTVARGFLDRTTARTSQLDHRAAKALIDHVDELRALGAFECSLGEALRFIRERVESLQVAAERPRPGHLYACRLQHAAFSGRPHLFVVGLEEGRVFPTASEDPVLLDAERAAISPALKRSTDRIDEAVYGVLSRLATWGEGRRDLDSNALDHRSPITDHGSITFSFSCRDTREFRETYASWLVLQAFRLQQGDATLSYQQMKAALGEPVSVLPATREAAATHAAWWLRSIVSTGEKGVEAVEASFAALARGREAEQRRDSSDFTEFDGHVPAAGASLDPCGEGNAFSVTDLESAATCPYRFFLKRGLGLRPVDDRERDKDVWLDALTKGSELHDIYAALHRRCRAEGRRPDAANDGAWLTSYAREALERLNREMPPATAEILERESGDFLADVELFLDGECEASGTEPIGFEVSFGRPLAEEEEDLARAEPVEIDLGNGLMFRVAGRIDRIDQVGPSEFRIVDYKTGGFWRQDWQGTFRGGRRLQHALYGLAAVELLRKRDKKAKVTGAEYYFSSHKGRRERVRIAAPTPAQTAAVLADLRALIVEGAFVHAHDKDACKFCDYEAACSDDVHARAEAKLGDKKLSAFGRLAAHV